MCSETITVAQCAPKVSPVLAFYCAKLHLVAKERIVCEAAKGKCICFFGSCGAIDREIPTKGINLSDVVKARCAECTPREHRVGNGIPAQQILESLWLNKTACPYHVDTSAEPATPVAEVINITEHIHLDTEVGHTGTGLSAESVVPTDLASESPELKPGFEAAVQKDFGDFSSSDNAAMKDASSSLVGPVFTDSFVAEPASSLVDEWTTNTAPGGGHGDNTENHSSDSGVKDILDPEEVGISTSRWAPGNSPTNSTKPTKPAVDFKENESGEEREKVQTPVVAVSRRAVNFSYNPDNAEKLLETAEMFANVKKAFLMGKA
ncbi:uncharacterized protein FFB14_01949 [Fusarium fujikuroi]|nr:uncharacterized protein FFB14_01949 [Fusarium fujikuroi]